MGCCETFAKYIIILFNVVFVLTGLFLIGVGAYVQIDAKEYISFLGSSYLNTPIILIVVGAVIFIIAFLGCCGAIKENKCMLYTYSTLLVLILLVEIGVGIAAFVLKGELKDVVTKHMNEGIANTNDTSSWDRVQETFKCCGVDDKDDWKKAGKLYPDSCCEVKSVGCGKDDSKPKFERGCLEQFETWFQELIVIIGVVALAFAVVQLLGACMACCVAKNSYYSGYQA
jgi:CD63 antigen